MERITVSIVGASGYSGMELLALLSRHRQVTLGALVAHTSAGKRVDAVNPVFAGRINDSFIGYDADAVAKADVAFIALPSGEALSIVPELLERGVRVVDLGGDFRLRDVSAYGEFYGREHTAAQLLPQAAYGMPELPGARDAVRGARLVANPGCYPTSAIIPLAPLVAAGLVQPEGITICSMSGTSGAGRSASADLSFSEVNESVKAYRVGRHQHIPEIRQALERAAGTGVGITFTPHLMPITRGIHTTINARLASGANAAAIASALHDAYANEPFVRLVGESAPELKHVVGTNRVDIGWHVDQRQGMLTLLATIDNLIKGAAGQAVQNMNILFGFDEREGLR